jgi:hypothetical protein
LRRSDQGRGAGVGRGLGSGAHRPLQGPYANSTLLVGTIKSSSPDPNPVIVEKKPSLEPGIGAPTCVLHTC